MRALPAVSVIVVTRDRPRLLAHALASIAAQSRTPAEVRIGDDGGGSCVPVAERAALLELTVLPLDCGHTARARNAAAAGARGEVLAFLDDDDLWHPEHLAGLLEAFDDPEVGFAWRDTEVVREEVDAAGERREVGRLRLALDWDDALMRSDDYLPPSAWGVRRALFERLGGFDTSFRYSEDWDFALRAQAAARVRRMPGVTVEVRLRPEGNASSDFTPERLDCLRRLAERHGFAVPGPKTFWEVARTLHGRSA